MAPVVKKPPKPTGPLVKGLPVYTKQQFLQVRPKGSYQGYLNYINRKRGAQPGATSAPKPGGQVPTYDSLLRGMTTQIETPAQLEARAKRMADADIASQTTILREDAEAQSKKAHERALALSAAGRAAAGMSAGLFNAVGGEYNAAAGELSRLGQMTGGMAAETGAQIAAENARLASVGQAPVEAAGVLAGPGQAAVEGYRGGTLAAQNFTTQGEAATFGLAGMVNAANLRATQEAHAAYNAREGEIQEARTKAVKEIARGRPEAAQKYLLQLQDAQRQQIALAMSLIEARNSRGDQILENQITRAQEGRDVAQEGRDVVTHGQEITAGNLEIKGARLALQEVDVTKSQALGYVVKKDGTPLLKNGKKIPFKVLAAQLGKGDADDLTPNERRKWEQWQTDEAKKLYYGTKRIKLGNGQMKTVAATESPGFDYDNPETWGTTTNYWTAMKALTQQGVPRARVEEVLNDFYPRGAAGAPLFYKKERVQMLPFYGTARYEAGTRQIRKLFAAGKAEEANALIDAMKNLRWRGQGAAAQPGTGAAKPTATTASTPATSQNYSNPDTWTPAANRTYGSLRKALVANPKIGRASAIKLVQSQMRGAPYKLVVAIVNRALGTGA